MMKRIFVVVFISCLMMSLLIPLAFSDEYYGDLYLNVENTGDVLVSGETNHPFFDNEANLRTLTEKQQGYWLFDLHINDTFSNGIFTIELPERAVINYMKVPALSRIEDSSQGIRIIILLENQSLDATIQYAIASQQPLDIPVGILIAGLGLVLFGIGFFSFKRHRIFKREEQQRYAHMTPRQKEIFFTIKQQGGYMTQSALEKKLSLPKSSLSRNIDALVRKQLLEKKQSGMTNTLFIKGQDKK